MRNSSLLRLTKSRKPRWCRVSSSMRLVHMAISVVSFLLPSVDWASGVSTSDLRSRA
ncbi:hypothetical protein X942_5904 [Burkholderia pseudomallei MSHR5596]|nr:hypothetical protein X942_5904 [Burkholderia pseudomallei MSHR5596]